VDKSGDHPEEDLVKPGYEPDMKVQNPNYPSISMATHSKLNIEIW
jgi:hypothetical protein